MHHVLKLFLDVFDHLRFLLGSFTSKLNVNFVLSLLAEYLLLKFQVSHFEVSLRCVLATSVVHILAFVRLLGRCDVGYSSGENLVFRG